VVDVCKLFYVFIGGVSVDHKISKYISREKKLQLLQCGERKKAGPRYISDGTWAWLFGTYKRKII
jgi:hypothetical protein